MTFKKKVFISKAMYGFENKHFYIEPWFAKSASTTAAKFPIFRMRKMICKSEEPNWWEKVSVMDFIKRELKDIKNAMF